MLLRLRAISMYESTFRIIQLNVKWNYGEREEKKLSAQINSSNLVAYYQCYDHESYWVWGIVYGKMKMFE